MATSWTPMTETGPRVTADDVCRYERELGHELPADYRQFLVDVNGGQPALERSVFHLRKDRSILNNLLSLNDPDEANDLATAQRLSGYSRHDLPKDALTIGYDAGGSRILLILAGPHRGEVWFLTSATRSRPARILASSGSIATMCISSPTASPSSCRA